MSTRPAVQLRPVIPSDLPRFFENESDDIAVEMAAFFSRDPADRAAFDAHWARILSAPDTVIRTIVVDGEVAGNVLVYGLRQQATADVVTRSLQELSRTAQYDFSLESCVHDEHHSH